MFPVHLLFELNVAVVIARSHTLLPTGQAVIVPLRVNHDFLNAPDLLVAFVFGEVVLAQHHTVSTRSETHIHIQIERSYNIMR